MAKQTTKKAQGLGDTVAQITEATGIDKLVKFIAGEDCGCEERKQKLNELFPYKTVKCLTEDEYTYLNESQVLSKQTLKPSEQDDILKIYNRIFGISREPTSCATCWLEIIQKMQKVFNEYKDEDANS
jgi:tyrosine-protein phosphatase YwqE